MSTGHTLDLVVKFDDVKCSHFVILSYRLLMKGHVILFSTVNFPVKAVVDVFFATIQYTVGPLLLRATVIESPRLLRGHFILTQDETDRRLCLTGDG